MAGTKKDKLSPKERAFCLAYISLKEGKSSAIRAGYSAKTAESAASRLLRNVKIRAEIDRLESKVETKAIITKQRVLDELALVGFSNMADCVKVGDQGQVQVIPFDEMPEGASRAIARIKEKRSLRQAQDGTGETIVDLQLEYGHHDKIAALKEISKLSDYYPAEKSEVEHKGTVTMAVEVMDFSKMVRPKKNATSGS